MARSVRARKVLLNVTNVMDNMTVPQRTTGSENQNKTSHFQQIKKCLTN